MLFVFPKADYYPFWMPDMHFPLDIIWIGADKKIISISENIPPLLDKTKPTYYLSPKPAQYVLEVKAGFAKKHNIKIGDTVEM